MQSNKPAASRRKSKLLQKVSAGWIVVWLILVMLAIIMYGSHSSLTLSVETIIWTIAFVIMLGVTFYVIHKFEVEVTRSELKDVAAANRQRVFVKYLAYAILSLGAVLTLLGMI